MTTTSTKCLTQLWRDGQGISGVNGVRFCRFGVFYLGFSTEGVQASIVLFRDGQKTNKYSRAD